MVSTGFVQHNLHCAGLDQLMRIKRKRKTIRPCAPVKPFCSAEYQIATREYRMETTSTRRLTTELFRRQAENPQITRVEALRQSMLSLMGKSATRVSTFSYAHPAFWAPFSLVGNGGR
jgi:hypothetical protein